jgi:nitroreductase
MEPDMTAGAATALPAADSLATDTLERLLRERYSCRGFRPEPVPRTVIERVLTLAQRTASWCNAQPWQLVITSGEQTDRFREQLSAYAASQPAQPDIAFPREYRGAYLQRRRDCGFALYDSVGIAKGDRVASARQTMENFRLFGAPHVAIVTTDEALGTYGVLDCGAYVSNFALAARSLGVATIAQAALAGCAPFIRSFFGLPEDRRVVCGISFGYEDAAHPANSFRTRRAEIAEAVTWSGPE